MNKLFQKYSLRVKDQYPTEVFTDNEKNEILANFLSMWKSSEDIKNIILPDIDRVLSGEVVEEEVDADVVGVADIGSEETFIGNSFVGLEQMFLPTKDFKQLWLEWIEILEDYQRTQKDN